MRWNADRHIAPRALKQYLDKRTSTHLESLGLPGSQGPYLMTVAKLDRPSMKEVSDYLMVNKSITTRTIGALIETGFVRNDSGDARRYSLVLTEKGEEAVKVIEEVSSEIWKEILSELTEEEIAALKSAASKINAFLSKDVA